MSKAPHWYIQCSCGQVVVEGTGYCSITREPVCHKRKWYNFWKHRLTRYKGNVVIFVNPLRD